MLDSDWLATCAPLGAYDSKNQAWKALGVGVFIYDEPFIWFITAHHIIKEKSDFPIHILINHAKTKHHLINIESMHLQNQIDWIIDEENDIAAALFPSDADFLIKSIRFPLFLSSKDIVPSMNCYTVGYPYNIAGFDVDGIISCVLKGIISAIDKRKNRIYVTVPTFPGNSGGPLFISKRSIHDESPTLDGNVVFLGGIIDQYILVGNAIEQNNHLSIPAMHLGVVIPSELIIKLLTSAQASILKEKISRKRTLK